MEYVADCLIESKSRIAAKTISRTAVLVAECAAGGRAEARVIRSGVAERFSSA